MMMGAFFGAAFLVNGVILPFFPVLLAGRGLTGEEIALVLAAPHIGRLVSMPVVAALADRMADRRLLVLGITGLMMLAGLAIGTMEARLPLMATAAVLLVANSVLGPIADTIALSLERRGLGDYGRMRLWGSLSFISGNLASGVALDLFGEAAVYPLLMAGFTIALASTLLIPRTAPRPVAAVAPADGASVWTRPALVAILAGAALVQSGHGALYGFATLTWQARGFDGGVIGAFWAIGVVAEIVLFAVAGRLFSTRSPIGLIAAAGAIGAVRWLLFSMDTGVAVTAVVQAMHAGSFALGHIGVMRLIRERVAEERAASATGAYVVLVGVGQAAAIWVAGVLWTRIGDDAFAFMAAFSLAGMVVLAVASRWGAAGGGTTGIELLPQPHSSGPGGNTVDPS
jgi:PPP family 3-phenylpropionic acid transporter